MMSRRPARSTRWSRVRAATRSRRWRSPSRRSLLRALSWRRSSTRTRRSCSRRRTRTAIASALEMLKGDVSKMYPSTGLGLVVKRSTPSKTNPPAPKAGGHWEWVPDSVQVQAKKEQQESTADDSNDDSDDDADDDSDDDEPVSFLQLNRPQNVEARKKVLGFLAGKATALKSTILSTLLVKIREAPSPFAKVKQMVQDLVSRLEAEAEAEADQKSWCDENMKETTAERDTAQRHIEDLNALHMEKSALVNSLAEDIMTLSQQIADLQKALNEATELREKESA